jgi:hypothetical protein
LFLKKIILSFVKNLIKMDAQVLIQNAARLPIPELEGIIHELNALVMRRKTTDKSYRMSFLLGKINTTVLGREKTERYQELVYKHEFETITDEEHAEWAQLADEEEKIRYVRLTYMVELSELKGITLLQLMEKLHLNPPSHA